MNAYTATEEEIQALLALYGLTQRITINHVTYIYRGEEYAGSTVESPLTVAGLTRTLKWIAP